MLFLDWIVEQLANARDWFLDAYNEVSSWITPFNWLRYPFYALYWVFERLTHYFGEFNIWLDWAAERILAILSEWDIWSYFQTWFEWAEKAWDWIQNAPGFVWSKIEEYWSFASTIVLGWIDAVKDWVLELVDDVKGIADKAWSAIDNFFTEVLPQLVGWGELESVINSTLKSWFPFYNALSYFWEEIEEFFSDPLEWVYNKIDEFFERYW